MAFEAQAQCITWPRPELWIPSYRLLHEQLWSPSLCNSGQDQRPLHRREALPDTYARPATKREVAVARTAGTYLGSPAIRVEHVGIRVEAGIAVHDILTHDDDTALGDHILPHRVIFQGTSEDHRRHRVESECLSEDTARVSEAGQVIQRGRAVAEHLIDLGVQAPLRFGVLCQEMPAPGKGIRCG